MESHLIVFCIVLTILTTSFAIVFWKCLNSEIEFLKAMSAMTLLFFFWIPPPAIIFLSLLISTWITGEKNFNF